MTNASSVPGAAAASSTLATTHRTDTAPGRTVDLDGLELALDPQHLLLHLLRHALQVGHPHADLLVCGAASLADADALRRTR